MPQQLKSSPRRQLSYIPLSKRAIQILEGLPGPHEGLIFPLSAESIRQARTRIRERAGLEKLLFRDLRHIAPTSYARAGMTVQHGVAIRTYRSQLSHWVELIALPYIGKLFRVMNVNASLTELTIRYSEIEAAYNAGMAVSSQIESTRVF